MSTTTAYPPTMADLKEPAHSGSLWSGYGGTMPLSTTPRFHHAMDSASQHQNHHQAAAAAVAASRPRTSIDHHHPYPYGPSGGARYNTHDETDAYDQQRQQPPPLTTHHSFPSLKRTYSESQQTSYNDMVQDLREDGSKLGVNHDHKLLAFKRVADKHTVVDVHGRMQQLELTAQLHGMFFLSEMPSSQSDGSMMQPELTCYRRNLFQISGSLITPRGQLSVVMGETGETVPVSTTEVTISAIESVDGHPVRLIVIPWKTPPPNSPELPQTPDQEPPTLPLIPLQDDGTEPQDGEYAVYPIGWRRLQFRIATANNGRRKELQQHFVLHLKVIATLASGSKVVLTESTTAPIVVRGRSPRNFQARKEIPLLGSSAGSRGQALVETGLGIVAGPLSIKPGEARARALNMELPRTAFTFSAAKLPGSPMTMRSNSYPTWNPPTQVPMSQMPTSATAAYPPTSIPEPYAKVPLSTSSFTAEPQEIPLQVQATMAPPPPVVSLTTLPSPPIRTQYAYTQPTSAPAPPMSLAPAPITTNGHHTTTSSTAANTLAVPRYVDNNPRPTKSPRTAGPGHQSVHSAGSITNDAQSEYRYGPPYPTSSNPTTATSDNYAPSSGPGGYNSTGVVTSGGPTEHLSSAASSHHPGHHGSSSSGGGPHSAASSAATSTASLPPRDYLPPSSSSWTTTAAAGESTQSVSYGNGDTRTYSYPDYNKQPAKPEAGGDRGYQAQHQGGGQHAYGGSALSHYSWSPT